MGLPGLAFVPPKIIQKVLRGKLIEMHELLPEAWRAEEDSCCRSTRPKRGLITDITLWTECYALLVGILSTKYPESTAHFMGSLRTIVRASQNWATIGITVYN